MNRLLMRLLPFASVLAVVALGLAAWSLAHSDARQDELIEQNRRSLLVDCARHDELTAKIARTEDVLQTESGAMIFGIPRALIVQGLEEDRKTQEVVALILGDACSKEVGP